jgi:putative IMPACT (imprinted ancient) family translation regulator
VKAKQDGKDAKFNVDKLIVDNKVLYSPVDKVRDINQNVTERAMALIPKHTGIIEVDGQGTYFQGHAVELEGKDDVIPALQALTADHKVAGATNIMYAYRSGHERYNVFNSEDDGEVNAGKEIMNVIYRNKAYNCLIAVTRWDSGKRLGPSRLQHVQKAAEEAFTCLKRAE